MNIFEILEKRELKPKDEFHRLVVIFNKEFWFDPERENCSLKQIFNKSFCRCPLRCSFLSIDDLLKSCEINERTEYYISWETLFAYCEVLHNVSTEDLCPSETNDEFCRLLSMLHDNMTVILEKTNHEWAKIDKGFVIVEKNSATSEAVECLETGNEDLALKMIEYNRVLLKGNLERKREILVSLASYTEPMKIALRGTEYSTLYSDSRNWVNNLNIRHNNSGKDTVPEYAKKWTAKQYEEWYDKIYLSLLMVIMAKRQLEIKQEMNKLQALK